MAQNNEQSNKTEESVALQDYYESLSIQLQQAVYDVLIKNDPELKGVSPSIACLAGCLGSVVSSVLYEMTRADTPRGALNEEQKRYMTIYAKQLISGYETKTAILSDPVQLRIHSIPNVVH